MSSMTQDSTASTSMSNAFSSPFQFTPSTSQPATPKPGQQAQAQAPAPQTQQAQPVQPASDPFAIFNTSTPKPAAQAGAPAPATAAGDDEWNFTSSLPPEANNRPKEQKSTISDGSIRAEFLANRTPASSNAINMVFSFSNNTAQPISEFHFQLAVTKVFIPFSFFYKFLPTRHCCYHHHRRRQYIFFTPTKIFLSCRASNSNSNPKQAAICPQSKAKE